MSARFEIVRTDAEQPFHARFVAVNGETVWATENYLHHDGALKAISLVAGAFGAFVYLPDGGVAIASPSSQVGDVEIREIDERTQP